MTPTDRQVGMLVHLMQDSRRCDALPARMVGKADMRFAEFEQRMRARLSVETASDLIAYLKAVTDKDLVQTRLRQEGLTD